MNFEKYTLKAQESIQKAAEIASSAEQQAIEPAHILKGLIQGDENILSFIFKKLNINRNSVETELDEILTSFPKVSDQQTYLSQDSSAALQRAEKFCKEIYNDISRDYMGVHRLGMIFYKLNEYDEAAFY